MTQSVTLIAPHAVGKRATDAIFATNVQARQAAQRLGRDAVVNAAVGSMLDDDEKLAMLPSVELASRRLGAMEHAAYAPFRGEAVYLEAAIDSLFRGRRAPDLHVEAVATPGGTGGLTLAFWEYLSHGDAVLVSDWFWTPYAGLAREHLRRLETYRQFNDAGSADLDDLAAKASRLLETQDRLLLVLNDPAHNPTGYAMSDDEWVRVVTLVRTLATETGKPVVVLVDSAYLDFDVRGEDGRNFLRLFTDLPSNLLVLVSTSVSKSLTRYGVRVGALIALSSSRDVIDEFVDTMVYACRSTWSNVNRGGMLLASTIWNDLELRAAVEAERRALVAILQRRADAFLESARDSNVPVLPYRSGFFCAVPCAGSHDVNEALKRLNVFAVAFPQGLRVALCSVPVTKIGRVAPAIRAAIDASRALKDGGAA